MTTIRPARAADLPALQGVERAAGAPFRVLGMHAVADDEPPPLEHLAEYQRADRAWVAEERGQVVGYLLVDVLAGAAHVEQVSVDPAHARRGIGRALIGTAERWAREHGLSSMTLTSFEHVPWNAPYYARLGFVVLLDGEQSSEIAAMRQAEADRGLDVWPRVAMRKQLEQVLGAPDRSADRRSPEDAGMSGAGRAGGEDAGGDVSDPVRTARGGSRLMVLCGRSFSGKSTVASWLGEGLDGQVISFDAINEERGLRGGDGIPLEEWSRTYDLARDRARHALVEGQTVIVDDTSSPRFLRDGWRSLAKDAGAPMVVVFVDTAVEVLLARQQANRSSGARQDVTDAVMTEHLATFEPPGPDEDAVRIPPGTSTPQQVITEVTTALARA